MLWPYRRSALKNTQRWTFGGVFPRAHAEARRGRRRPVDHADAVPRRGRRPATRVGVTACGSCTSSGARWSTRTGATSTSSSPAGERHLTWEEAVEREIALGRVALDALAGGRRLPIAVPAGRARGAARGPPARSCARGRRLDGRALASPPSALRRRPAPGDRADREHDAVAGRPARGGAAARRSARRTPCCGRAAAARSSR